MVKLHLKRLASPKTWPIPKKTLTFIARPFPGPHKLEHQIPISVFLRDLIGVVHTQKEVKYVLHNKDCLIDGDVCHDNKRPVGLFDVVSLPKAKSFYRLTVTSKNKLAPVAISEKEAKTKISKIVGKTSLKKGKVQLNLSDGRNILVDEAKAYAIGDSLLLELPGQKIADHFPFTKDAPVFLIGGRHVGAVAQLQDIDNTHVTVKVGEDSFKTKRSYAVVIGKNKPIITVE